MVATHSPESIKATLSSDRFKLSKMKNENIFDLLNKYGLIRQISQYDNLLFIGEKKPLKYLKKIFEGNTFHFIVADDLLYDDKHFPLFSRDIISGNPRQAIIIVSLENEEELYKQVQSKIGDIVGTIPILKLFSDIFVNSRLKQYLLKPSECEFKSPKISYAIITTPRSGSTFLCEALKATQVAGFPDEHLRDTTEELVKNCHFDCLRYLRILMTHEVTNNGVFGTKFISHFLLGHEKFEPNFHKIFDTYISKFIFLVRRDKLAQAVSIFIAKNTQIWHSFQIDKPEEYEKKLSQIDVEDADLEKIHTSSKSMLIQEQQMEKLLNKYSIDPLVIEYEDFIKDTRGNIKNVLEYLGVKDEYPSIDTNQFKTKKLSSELSDRIREKYYNKYSK
jgi:LPS sulfotransferase NodH